MNNNTSSANRPRLTTTVAILAAALSGAGGVEAAELGEVRLRLGESTEDADPEGATFAALLEPASPPAWLTWAGNDVHYEAALSVWRDAGDDGDDIYAVHFGPSWHYAPGLIEPVFVEVGVAPSAFSEDELAGRDIGGQFQFTSHVTFGSRFAARERWQAGLHIQHVSNAGLEDSNPGINTILLEVGYRLGRR